MGRKEEGNQFLTMTEVLGFQKGDRQATQILQVELLRYPKVRRAVDRGGLMVFLCVDALFIITSFTGTVGPAANAA